MKITLFKTYEEKVAFVLLSPVVIMLAIFALYPFAMTIYFSFTDDAFASSSKTSFIGIENYKKLLLLTIKETPPKTNEDGSLSVDKEDNPLQYVSSIKVLPRKPYRYKEWFTFHFLGKRYVVGTRDRQFYKALVDTIYFSLIAVFLETLLGLSIALAFNKPFWGRGLMRAVLLIPWAIPTAVSSRMWAWMFNASRVGFFNSVFSSLGLNDGQTAFLATPELQLPIMIVIDVWKTTPFMALMLMAGLSTIPQGLYEAATIDGAGVFRRFWNITMPMLLPILAVALIFRTLDSLRVFDLFQIVYGQTRFSLSSFTYYHLLNNRQTGYSSAAGVLIFVLLLGVAVLYMKVSRRNHDQ